MSTAWTSRYAQRTKGLKSSAIRELLKLTQRPEIISFAGGLPASDLFPTDRFAWHAAKFSSNNRTSPCSTAPPRATNHFAKWSPATSLATASKHSRKMS